jgi:hypothetical protein
VLLYFYPILATPDRKLGSLEIMGKPSSTILTIIYNYYNNNILKSVTSIFSGDPYIFNSNPLGFSPAVPSGSCSLGLPRCLATHPLDERSVS